jgi:hypothetical protein
VDVFLRVNAPPDFLAKPTQFKNAVPELCRSIRCGPRSQLPNQAQLIFMAQGNSHFERAFVGSGCHKNHDSSTFFEMRRQETGRAEAALALSRIERAVWSCVPAVAAVNLSAVNKERSR